MLQMLEYLNSPRKISTVKLVNKWQLVVAGFVVFKYFCPQSVFVLLHII